MCRCANAFNLTSKINSKIQLFGNFTFEEFAYLHICTFAHSKKLMPDRF